MEGKQILNIPVALAIFVAMALIPMEASAKKKCYGYTNVHQSDVQSFWSQAKLDVIRKCVAKYGINIESQLGFTPLHAAAAYSKDPAIVSYLIAKGADIRAQDNYGFTPLHLSVTRNKLEQVTSMLIDAGAGLDVQDHYNRTPLHWSAIRSKTPEIFGLLINKGASFAIKDENGKTAFDLAHVNAYLKDTSVIKSLKQLLEDKGLLNLGEGLADDAN
ncbi:MAG: ankyrin repeat domain-containing protein [Gammaproteobacteria bacterium]